MIATESKTVDKSAWQDGPWINEPDHKVWRDTATDLPCLAHRHPSLGHWCGYVAVPPGHVAHGKGYDSLYETAPEISVHGGLTYANKCAGAICHTPEEGEPDDVWWLGFDCAHAGDLSPGTDALLRNLGQPRRSFDETYKTLGYVERECADLAKQLAAMA